MSSNYIANYQFNFKNVTPYIQQTHIMYTQANQYSNSTYVHHDHLVTTGVIAIYDIIQNTLSNIKAIYSYVYVMYTIIISQNVILLSLQNWSHLHAHSIMHLQ